MGDTVHPVREFEYLPWGMLDPEKCTRDWSFGKGGNGTDDKSWHVSIFKTRHPSDSDVDIWILPPQIGAMLDIIESIAKQDMQREIRCALGL